MPVKWTRNARSLMLQVLYVVSTEGVTKKNACSDRNDLDFEFQHSNISIIIVTSTVASVRAENDDAPVALWRGGVCIQSLKLNVQFTTNFLLQGCLKNKQKNPNISFFYFLQIQYSMMKV